MIKLGVHADKGSVDETCAGFSEICHSRKERKFTMLAGVWKFENRYSRSRARYKRR